MDNNRSRIVLVTVPITGPIEEDIRERIQQISTDLQVEVYPPTTRMEEIPAEIWQHTEILCTFSNLPDPRLAPHLRWVQLYSAGANHIFGHPLAQSDVIFTTASGVHSVVIAEHVLTTILDWFHRFPAIQRWRQTGQWPSREEHQTLFRAQELRGQTIGIVGYGSIGRETARLARAFGMRVIAQQLSEDHRDYGFIFPGIGDPEGTLPERYYRPDQLHELLNDSDVVVAAVPLTRSTTRLFDEAAFRAMKPTAFFVNIARGEVCDEDALIRALQEGHIAGAALDVFAREPLPSDSPLWHLPNVFMSPHISGLTTQYNQRALTIFIANLRRYLAGEKLYNVVDKERQY
jgi:phosphoglycerate dehydrogenase-like enzyme